MFVFVKKLIFNLNLGKHRCGVQLIEWAGLFILARIPQIDAVAGTIERDLALLTATYRTDTSVNSGAKALLFAGFADLAAHGAPVQLWHGGTPAALL